MDTNVSKLTGIALATAVAGLFTLATASPAFAADEAKVKCEHSSACKGQGACKQASNSCKGQNACKGEGFTMQKSKADCKAAQDAAKK
ncbi:MAG TPA: hypothetical protein VGC30_07065 [Dokdonella sp.]